MNPRKVGEQRLAETDAFSPHPTFPTALVKTSSFVHDETLPEPEVVHTLQVMSFVRSNSIGGSDGFIYAS